jgi:hypothetical protein
LKVVAPADVAENRRGGRWRLRRLSGWQLRVRGVGRFRVLSAQQKGRTEAAAESTDPLVAEAATEAAAMEGAAAMNEAAGMEGAATMHPARVEDPVRSAEDAV